jgi:hypothetical protein
MRGAKGDGFAIWKASELDERFINEQQWRRAALDWVVSDATPVFAISMTACNTSARGTIDAAK